MEFKEEVVLSILALAVNKDVPNHHLEYLLKKLYGFDSLTLDSQNKEIYFRMMNIVQNMK